MVHVSLIDFIRDQLSDDKILRASKCIDEYNRSALGIEILFSLSIRRTTNP